MLCAWKNISIVTYTRSGLAAVTHQREQETPRCVLCVCVRTHEHYFAQAVRLCV